MKAVRKIESEPLLVSVPDAGDMLGIGRSTIYQMIDAGTLKTVNIGRRRLVRVSDIRAFVEEIAA